MIASEKMDAAELGIDFDVIRKRFVASMIPFHSLDTTDDTDLAGPLIVCLALGFLLMLVRARILPSLDDFSLIPKAVGQAAFRLHLRIRRCRLPRHFRGDQLDVRGRLCGALSSVLHTRLRPGAHRAAGCGFRVLHAEVSSPRFCF